MQGSDTSNAPRHPVNANEGALALTKIQEEALARLPLKTLYIGLWIRADPPKPNDFHWGYYFHTSSKGGEKYHMKNLSSGWILHHGHTSGVFKSNFLCVLIQIAVVPEANHDLLDQIMKSRDRDVNDVPGVTCRVWVLIILQKLIRHGLVRCSSVDGLQEECMAFGNKYSADAAGSVQPRPVLSSTLCL